MKGLYLVSSIFNFSVMAAGLVMLIIFLFNYKRLDKAGRYIFYYTIVCNIMIALMFAGLFLLDISWIQISNVRLLVQYYPLAGFYYHIIRYHRVKKLIKISLVPVALLFIPDFLWWGGDQYNSTVFATIRNLLLCGYGAAFIVQLLTDEALLNQAIPVTSLPDFWYNAGLFIYHCTFLPAGLGGNLWWHSSDHAMALLILVLASGDVQFLLFYVGVRKVKQLARYNTTN